ncbi:hypothetical protein CANINC_000877 [Pichia inconspicua]|uniref:Trafficking protein particle complex III-specific subunit 85 n=1 Tax=Pichia inconspicua TaxID=52247 RepID=A0A4T0X6P6_9ASCO|nr:hypothetical protein CANINC_000877 [[Candida] inconspicua]
MDLSIPSIYGSLPTKFYHDICGCSSEKYQQLMITAYAPRVSVLSSELADDISKQFGNIRNVCHLFSYFENCLAFGTTFNQKIDTKVNSKNTESLSSNGCVRFVPDRFTDYNSSNSTETSDFESCRQGLKSYVKTIQESILNISDELNYDSYKSNYNTITKLQNSIYLKLHSLLYSSNELSPFECFNHPIAQAIVVSGYDTIEHINSLLSNIENTNIPRWIDVSAILQHVIILVNHDDSEMLQSALKLQETLRIRVGKSSAIVPLDLGKTEIDDNDPSNLKLYPSIYTQGEGNVLIMNKESYESWKRPLQELISKNLITFMNSKIKTWSDEVVQPKTSLAGRIFGGKKWAVSTKTSFFSFGSNSNTQDVQAVENTQKQNFNAVEGYYDSKSFEMILRRLGDWYFMLGDFKNAQTVYELVKKDMVNDKAYSHVASINEFIVYSYLLGAINNSEVNLTTKFLTSSIRPMIDSSFYAYLSRSNLKFYTIRMTLTSAELLLLWGQSMLAKTKKIDQLIELALNESIALLRKVIDSKLVSDITCGFLMQRIAFIFGSYSTMEHYSHQKIDDPYYDEENPMKKQIEHPSLESIGLTRIRKQELWLLLSAKELDIAKEPLQSKLIMWKIGELMEIGAFDVVATDWIRNGHSLLYKLECHLAIN